MVVRERSLPDLGVVKQRVTNVSFRRFIVVPAVSALVFFVTNSARADVQKGAQLARQWCANCHVIGGKPTSAVPQGPPTFSAVAQSMTADQLHAFLSHPHGAMPDLALTRAEIDDLIGYIETLR
jgi:mono/diheme cytochrome c family protein